jgi:hypothetical protein
MSRFPLLLIILGMFIPIINTLFFHSDYGFIIGSGLLFIASGLFLSERKRNKGYKSFASFVRGEWDIIILMFGVILFGSKFLFPEGIRSTLHLISISLIILIIGWGGIRERKL